MAYMQDVTLMADTDGFVNIHRHTYYQRQNTPEEIIPHVK